MRISCLIIATLLRATLAVAQDPLPGGFQRLSATWTASAPSDGACSVPTDSSNRPWYDPQFSDPSWKPIQLPDVNSLPFPGNRFYRGTFALDSLSKGASLFPWSDDSVEIFVNGQRIGAYSLDGTADVCGHYGCVNLSCNGNAIHVPPIQISSDWLHVGTNTIAVHLTNSFVCCGSYFDLAVLVGRTIEQHDVWIFSADASIANPGPAQDMLNSFIIVIEKTRKSEDSAIYEYAITALGDNLQLSSAVLTILFSKQVDILGSSLQIYRSSNVDRRVLLQHLIENNLTEWDRLSPDTDLNTIVEAVGVVPGPIGSVVGVTDFLASLFGNWLTPDAPTVSPSSEFLVKVPNPTGWFRAGDTGYDMRVLTAPQLIVGPPLGFAFQTPHGVRFVALVDETAIGTNVLQEPEFFLKVKTSESVIPNHSGTVLGFDVGPNRDVRRIDRTSY